MLWGLRTERDFFEYGRWNFERRPVTLVEVGL